MRTIKPSHDPRAISQLPICFLLLTALLTVICLMLDFSPMLIPIGSTHPFWLNVFFINYTFIGDGVFACCLVLILFFYFKKKQEALLMLSGFFISFIVIQVIKNLLGNGSLDLYFEQGQYLFFTKEENLVNAHAFPSGHTAFAFVIATTWVLRIKKIHWQCLVILGGLLLGFSRMYLAAHTILDITAGMLIGVTSVLCVHLYLHSNVKHFAKHRWYRANRNDTSFNSGNIMPI
jgi:undecaprenyl-diphosphatase